MPLPLEERVKLYSAWLQRRNGFPLTGILWEPDIPLPKGLLKSVGSGNSLTPANFDFRAFLPDYERWHIRESRLTHHVIHSFCPALGMPWVEALAGCPLTVHEGSIWAGECMDDYKTRPAIRFDPENPWVLKLLEFTDALVELSGGRFPVAVPQMRGPLDVLSALRTPARLCMDLIEQPENVMAALSEITDLWIEVNSAVLGRIPSFHSGYASRMKMWSPGPAVTPQNDVSTLISPELYCDIVLPFDRKIMDAFPFHSYHMHATERHQVDNILSLDKLTAIQITLEHTLGGPPLEVMMPVLRRVLEKKPLILVPLDLESADFCLKELPPQGLFVMIGWQGDDVGEELEAWAKGKCG